MEPTEASDRTEVKNPAPEKGSGGEILEVENNLNAVNLALVPEMKASRIRKERSRFEERSHLQLAQKLSEKELDILELKKNFLHEISVLKSLLQKREVEILNKDSEVRKLNIRLQECKVSKQDVTKKYNNLKVKQQGMIKESLMYKRTINERNLSMNKKEVSYNEVMHRKNSEISQLRKELKEMEKKYLKCTKRLNAQEQKFKEDEARTRAVFKEKMAKISGAKAQVETEEQALRKQLELYKTKYGNLNDRFVSMRNKSERNDLLVDKLKSELDNSYTKIRKLKAEVDCAKNQKALYGKNRVKDANLTTGEDADRMKLQLVTMKNELRSCVSHLNEWKDKANKMNATSCSEKQTTARNLLKMKERVSELEKELEETQQNFVDSQAACKEAKNTLVQLQNDYNKLISLHNDSSNQKVIVKQKLSSGVRSVAGILLTLILRISRDWSLKEMLQKRLEELKTLISTILDGQQPDVDMLLGSEEKTSRVTDVEVRVSQDKDAQVGLLKELIDVLQKVFEKSPLDNNSEHLDDGGIAKLLAFCSKDNTNKSLGVLLQSVLDAYSGEKGLNKVTKTVCSIRATIVERYTERIGDDCITQ